MIIELDRPILDAVSVEQNIAYIDTWIAKTVDELRYRFGLIGESEEGGLDYNALNNLPSINGVTLIGNRTSEELNIPAGIGRPLSENEVILILGSDPGYIYDPSTAIHDYEDLDNLPQIEGETLEGNKTFAQLHMNELTVQEIERVLYLG